MDKIPVDAKRDIVLIGHHGSGKTQIVDAMLFNAKLIDRKREESKFLNGSHQLTPQ